MSLSETIRSDLEFIESELENQTFTWENNEYICIPNTANEQRDLEIGGFQIVSDLILSVRVDQFTASLPSEQDVITYFGRAFRINKVGTTALGVYIRLHCSAIYRGV